VQVYVEEFESFLLDATAAFYHEESREKLARHSAPEYLCYAGESVTRAMRLLLAP